ncbi:AAA family ATPase [Palleronia sp. KMU-117]|uniref:AAA family ATPase n=1 Tax=Palleronia sp. KMU-117 TaxID=3434108 RepID=UPI003D756666
MDQSPTSLLLISSDDAVSLDVQSALADDGMINVVTKSGTLAQMNGSAASIAKMYDIVVFTTDPDDPDELKAIEDLSANRASNAVFFALTDDDLPLSKVRKLSRCGVDDIMPKGALREELRPQIATWKQRRDAMLPAVWAGPQKKGRIITVAQARGGVGSTTVAVNLADQLLEPTGFRKKHNKHSVVIVDLDFQFGTVGTMLDVDANDGLIQLAMDGFVPTRDYVEQCIVTVDSGLAVLPAPSKFGPLEALKVAQVEAILTVLQESYDYVVVDLPRALVSWLEPILAKSDEVILVTDVTVPSVRAARKLMDFFLAEQPGLTIEIVVNFEKKPVLLASHHREAAKLLAHDFSYWLPRNDRAARETVDRGCPLSRAAPHSDLAKSMRKLARATIRKFESPQTTRV